MKYLISDDFTWIGKSFVIIDHCNITQYITTFSNGFGKNSKSIYDDGMKKLKEICSNPNVMDNDIQKQLTGYPKNWYECKIFGQSYGKDIRLVYLKTNHPKDKNIKVVNLIGIYNHKDIINRLPLRKRNSIRKESISNENLTADDVQFLEKFL